MQQSQTDVVFKRKMYSFWRGGGITIKGPYYLSKYIHIKYQSNFSWLYLTVKIIRIYNVFVLGKGKEYVIY